MGSDSSGLISIIMPAYRAERFVAASVTSIFGQDYSNWELLVWEDGCLDRTVEIVSAMSAPGSQAIRIFRAKENRGVSHARNCALERARGQFIAFMDADDTWEPEHLSTLMQYLGSEDATMVFSGNNFIDENGGITKRNEIPSREVLSDLADRLYDYNFILVPSVMVRREIIDRGFKFDENLTHGEDLDFWLQIIAADCRITLAPVATYNYRKHGESAMANSERVVFQMLKFYEKHYQNPMISVHLRRRYLKDTLFAKGRFQRRKEPWSAYWTFLRAWKVNVYDLRLLAWAFLSVVSGCFHRVSGRYHRDS